MKSPEGVGLLRESEETGWGPSEAGGELDGGSMIDHSPACTTWDSYLRCIHETLPPTLPDGFTDDSRLPRLQFSSVAAIADPFFVTAASMTLINDARLIQTMKEHDVEALSREACAERSVRLIKLELPVLRSDEKYDNLQLMRRVAAQRTPNLADHRLPLEPVDIERDEGLEFPSSARHHAETIIDEIKHDTIDVSKDTMAYLTALLKCDWTHDEQMDLLNGELTYRKNPATEPFTPPISPKLTSEQHWVPPEEACVIPLSSDPSSGIRADIEAAEGALFKENGETWSPGSTQLGWPDMMDGDISSDNLEQNVPGHDHPMVEEMKLELPLSRTEFDTPAVVPVDMEQVVGSPPPLNYPKSQDLGYTKSSYTAEIMDDALKKELEDAQAYTMRSTEQEKLVPLDALARAPVPIMDFSIPKPAWYHLSHNSSRLFRWIRECNSEAFRLPKWPRNKNAESKMIWTPVASTAVHISLSESIEDHDGFLTTISTLQSEVDICAIEALSWNGPGLATLLPEAEDQDEDEIVPISLAKTASDLMTLVHKRSSILEPINAKPNAAAGEGNTSSSLTSKLSSKRDRSRRREMGHLLLDDDHLAISKLLDNFMLMNPPKKRTLEKSSFFSAAEPTPKVPENKRAKTTREAAPEKPLGNALTAALVPPIKVPPDSIKIIVSVNIPRAVLRGLEEQLPGLQVVDRDHNAHNESVWYPGSVCRSEMSPPLADEADITISPATGVILTSTVKVRQKPVPGADTSVLRSRVEKVSLRHERLLVLVSEGSADENPGAMAPQAALALAELQGFVQSLESAVLVLYVPGGQATLAKWAAALVCQYHQEAAEISQYILERETYWELFLRRAGVNAYAAQVIAGMLQAPDAAANLAQPGQYGLSAFVQMSQEERVSRFSAVLGGRKVLDRAGRLIDAGW